MYFSKKKKKKIAWAPQQVSFFFISSIFERICDDKSVSCQIGEDIGVIIDNVCSVIPTKFLTIWPIWM